MSIYKLLDKISSPDDLKAMPEEDMPALANEIRAFLIENIAKTGGHLASNLGVVELTLALHRQFSTPHDHIIWDVGHQSYVHKIITGRRKLFDTLRTPGGLSGFTKRSESEHDCFGAGHSSTSLSAALGFAQSDALRRSDAYTVVVLGDGAFTGGMIHEAINNCKKNLRLIIILNENEMSISKNIGAFARYISRIRSTKKYYKAKDAAADLISKIPLIGKGTVNLMRDAKQTVKNAMYASNYFEEMDLYYMGPVDGNDFKEVNDMLEVAKSLNRSTVIHITTKKGKGYRPSELSPQNYHSVPKGGISVSKPSFSTVFGDALAKKALVCSDICAITAAMPQGTGLENFKYKIPTRFFDVGIAEEHAATFAAGLAANGMRPFFAVYSSFLQRAYDNILHDIALQNLPVTICIDRAGLNSSDGATHHGIFDVSFLSGIPGIEIYTPVTFDSLIRALTLAYKRGRPCAIRYPKGTENKEIKDAFYNNSYAPGLDIRCDFSQDEQCKCVIITYGSIASEALAAKKLFAERNISCGVILLEKLKPYEDTAGHVCAAMPFGCETVIFLEEGIENGGAAMCLWEKLREEPQFSKKRYIIRAIDNDFAVGEKGKSLLKSCGLCAKDIVNSYFQKNNN